MRLTAENMDIARGGRLLLRKCSFVLGPGEALVVTGPNGAGKSSLLRAIAGFLPLAEGKITTDSPEASLAEQAHYIGHANALKASLTATETLDFWAAMLRVPGGTQTGPGARAALAALGLTHVADLPCGYLSAGQKRRVALARLLSAPRPLWLLDEPAAALDSGAQLHLERLIRDHLAGGGLVIAALHAPLDIGAVRELRLGAQA